MTSDTSMPGTRGSCYAASTDSAPVHLHPLFSLQNKCYLRGYLLVFIILALQFCLSATASAGQAMELRPEQSTRGSLWLQTGQDARYQPAPTLDTEVRMDITGMLARVRVRQQFNNPGSAWAEGVYVFPLPENAAVDHLRMHIGERVIEGQIREREEAKKTYEQAKKTGRRASLVEQERANIFTTSLANIAPGESITVEIEYQQTVRYDDGAFRLRFPMVVGPRYIPGLASSVQEQVSTFSGTGWAQATTQVPDAARITPPVQHPDAGSINPVRLNIHLNAGMPLAEIRSPYHAIRQSTGADGNPHIELAAGPVPADRDFELLWRPRAGSAPNAAWFTQRMDGRQYGLLMLVPPQNPATDSTASRELVFVIDTSGSMHGESIKQARSALLLALDRLSDRDRFNIIRFNHRTGRLFTSAQPADANNLSIARRFVRQLQADGGTEMRPALEMALQQAEQTQGIRQVVFITDGSVGNEAELFRVIRRKLGNNRLFTVGIGSAPNSHFMRKAAEYGRGTFTYIGHGGEVMEKASGLFRKLENPALTDIRIELPSGVSTDMLPTRIPDLYLGEPLLLAFKGQPLPDRVVLHGRFGEQAWQSTVTLDGGEQGVSLAPEWGRRRIAMLMTQMHDADDPEDREKSRQDIIETALAHHLVSKYTSLVAVDVTPARKQQEWLQQHAMKTNLPKGWSYDHVFGLAQTATPARLQIITGLMLLLLAATSVLWPRKSPC